MTYFFIHTTKTSGTTFMEVLRKDSENNVGFFYPKKEMDDFEKRIKEGPMYHLQNSPDWKKYNFIGGHFTYGIHEVLNAEQFKYIGVIREPLSHYISFYRAFLRMPEDYQNQFLPESKSIKDMLKLKFTHNIQTWFISGLSMHEIEIDKERAYQTAIRNIENDFVGIYPTEKFDEGLFYFKEKINLNPKFYNKKNVAENGIYESLSEELIEEIKKYNDVDIRLYEYLFQKFDDETIKIPFLKFNVFWFRQFNKLYNILS
jgi:hypothetical protein